MRTLSADRLEEWLDHVCSVFTHTPRAYFARHWRTDPYRQWRHVFVATEADAIVSTVRVFVRQAFVGRVAVSVGGIGEVSTKPEHRGKGLATKLLKDALRSMRAAGMRWATLHTGSAAPVYERLGFHHVPHLAVLHDAAASVVCDDVVDMFTVEPFTWDSSAIDSMCTFYAEHACHFDGAFVRSREYWQSWVAAEAQQEHCCAGVVTRARDATCVGWFAARLKPGTDCVLEVRDVLWHGSALRQAADLRSAYDALVTHCMRVLCPGMDVVRVRVVPGVALVYPLVCHEPEPLTRATYEAAAAHLGLQAIHLEWHLGTMWMSLHEDDDDDDGDDNDGDDDGDNEHAPALHDTKVLVPFTETKHAFFALDAF